MLFRVGNSLAITAAIVVTWMLGVIRSQSAANYNCNTYVSSTNVTDYRTFALGDTMTLCIHFLPFNVKIGFQVTVDTYQALTMRRTFEATSASNTDLIFQAANSYPISQQVVSLQAVSQIGETSCLSRHVAHNCYEQREHYKLHSGRHD